VRAPGWDPNFVQLRTSALSMSAVFATFFTAWLIEDLAHLHTDVVVLGVVLALTLSRTNGKVHGSRRWAELRRLGIVAVVAAGAGTVGTLMIQHVVLGDVLFTVAVSVAIWLRRFGPLGRTLGTLISLPFISLLVAPAAPTFGAAHTAWTAAVAGIALTYVTAFALIGRRLHWIPPAPTEEAAPARASTTRISASTRMAVQMAVGVGLAFFVGHQVFGQHWPWVVVTAYITASGNRGRGDVVYKGVLRLVGASVGTIAATVLANAFDPGDRWAVVAIFTVVAVAHWLRGWNYAFWAAGVTAALALLYGYSGVSGLSLLADRLGAVCVGAIIAVGSAWLVLPVRTTAVLKRRVADTLAELSDFLTAARRRDHQGLADQHRRLAATVAGVEQLAPTIHAHRFASTWWSSRPHPADAVRGVRALHGSAENLTRQVTADPTVLHDPELAGDLARLHGALTATRRQLGKRPPGEDQPEPPRETGTAALPHPAELHDALDRIAGAFS